jgi:3-deoxy-D-manno-octulosonic-acid transferase
MSILYDIGIFFYVLFIRIASLFHPKASLWLKGRKNWKQNLKGKFTASDRVAWFHCASLGEFEMARPIIEYTRKHHPEFKVLVTFFSPSGYEIRKNYEKADVVMYLPADTSRNAKLFYDLVPVELAVFAKYEFWHHYIDKAFQRNIKLFAISSVFRTDHRFFKWYGGFFRNDLRKFTRIFVQDQQSYALLKGIEIDSVITGDTRFDRVANLREHFKTFADIEKWIAGRPVVIGGSCWEQEELRMVNGLRDDVVFIFVPHDISEAHLRPLEAKLNGKSLRYSQFAHGKRSENILIVDTVGMLMSLYRYADIAFVGGGYSGKLHNILEPATFGCAVLFGPKHQRFHEADAMLQAGAALVVNDDFAYILQQLLQQKDVLDKMKSNAMAFIDSGKGAVNRTCEKMFANA